MTAKELITFSILFLGLFLISKTALAQNPFDIKFPIPELGNCQDLSSCKNYCDNSDHSDVCIAFGKEHNLISDQDVEKAKQQNALEQEISTSGGPGGCTSKDQCKAYCQDSSHLDECLKFGQEHGLVSEKEAEHIKKNILVSGPGGCKGQECHDFCEKPENQLTCVNFAEQNGFMKHEDAERARKFAGKTGPGGCTGQECQKYCQVASHQAECLQFAKENGLISNEEADQAEQFLKEGGPGGCKTQEECEKYCQENSKECFDFAKEKGLIKPEDEENFNVVQKLQETVKESGGPGGCKTPDECKTYCMDENHVEECVAFASAHGGVSEEKAREMLKKFTEQKFEGQDNFNQDQEEQDRVEKFEEFKELEQNFRGPGQFEENDNEQSQGKRFVGPGGCASPDECIQYCSQHQEECFSFKGQGQPTNGPPQIRAGITHQLDPKEYEKCKNNPEECRQKYFREQGQPPNDTQKRTCPLMPTVNECPKGQTKTVIYSSEDCGTYYGCRPTTATNCPEGQYWNGTNCISYALPPSSGNVQNLQENPSASPEENPADDCAKLGGTWTGDDCQLPNLSPTGYLPTHSPSRFLADFSAAILNFLFLR